MNPRSPSPTRLVRSPIAANDPPEDRGIPLEPISGEAYSPRDHARSNPSKDSRKPLDDPERRIEDWIVRSLDDEPAPSLNRVLDRMLSATLGKRRARPGRDRNAEWACPEATWSRFRADKVRGVTVVTLLDSSLVKESTLDGLEAELGVLIASGARRIVLNFAGVERLSSRSVLTMVRVSRKCSATPGGRLRACRLRAEIAGIAGLIPSIEIFADEESAVGAPWPGPPIVTPLPISILSELTSAQEIGVDDPTLEIDVHRGPYELPDELDLSRSWASTTGRPSIALIVADGPMKGRSIPLIGDRFLIGREPGCQLRIESPSVSRIHASIEIVGDRVVFRDLDSTNGSILNGVAIRDRSATLRQGDRIEIDSGRFLVSIGIGPAAADLDARVVDWLAESDVNSGPSPETLVENEPKLPDALARFGLEEFSEVLRCEMVEDVVILTPLTDELDDESRIEPLRAALLELMIRRAPLQVVVNLAFVSRMSSHATGVLVAHHLRLQRSGGALRCCLAQPLVASYLATIRLPMLVDLYTNLEDAVLTTW